ncbi:MAG TPA: hypothetical protein VE178_01605 [Silvibacterium sp.]|nr:hypothetical protein [Silvibacterium sp.]
MLERLNPRTQNRDLGHPLWGSEGKDGLQVDAPVGRLRVGGILQDRIWRNPRKKDLQTVNELVTNR